MTVWAMRMPRSMVKSSCPQLMSRTPQRVHCPLCFLVFVHGEDAWLIQSMDAFVFQAKRTPCKITAMVIIALSACKDVRFFSRNVLFSHDLWNQNHPYLCFPHRSCLFHLMQVHLLQGHEH